MKLNHILLASIAIMLRPDDGANASTGTAEPPPAKTPEAIPVTGEAFRAAHPVVETSQIEIKKLAMDAGTQPRVSLDDEVVKEYTETVKAHVKDGTPQPFPPITIFRDPTGRCVPADGFHRIAAHKEGKAKEILAEIREGTQRDALLFACSANATHGVRRTGKDKQRAVKILLQDHEWTQWSNRAIASACEVSEWMVRDLRPSVKAPAVRKAVKGGKVTTVNTSAIGNKEKAKVGKKAAAVAKSTAKKAGKKAPAAASATPASSSDVETARLQEMAKIIRRIGSVVGGPDGDKITKALLDGSLALTEKEIKAWNDFSENKIKLVAPLVTGGARMKPTQAFDFIGSSLNPKIAAELHNRALGSDGEYEYESDTLRIVATILKHP